MLVVCFGCNTIAEYPKGTFGYDLAYLQRTEELVMLQDGEAMVMVSPSGQGRVLTSTSNGLSGRSYGWLNKKAIDQNSQSKTKKPIGGEDRLWLGPLGSRYTLYYGGKEIAQNNWRVPALLSTAPFQIRNQTERSVALYKEATIQNNIQTTFSIAIDREITLLSRSETSSLLGVSLPKPVRFVGFESINRITNRGDDWKKEAGLIAPWVLGKFPGSSKSVAVFPYKKEVSRPFQLRKYLGDFAEDRVQVLENVVCFKTDGAFRSKVGLKPQNTVPVLGNVDVENQVLTIVTFSFDENGSFLSSTETESPDLFGGDVVNAYNHTPVKGQPTFFELESAAPARELKTGQSITHIHRTFHFEGPLNELNELSRILLGVALHEVQNGFD